MGLILDNNMKMSKGNYSFKQDGPRSLISVHAETDLLERVNERNEEFSTHLKYGKKAGTVITDTLKDGGIDFIFDFKRAWRKRDKTYQHQSVQVAKATLVTLVNCDLVDEEEPEFYARIGSRPIADGRISMMVELRWPEVSDIELSKLATCYMREVANDLRYPNPKDPKKSSRHVEDLVYAQIQREYGAELQTNPIGSCSIGTDGSTYYPSDSLLELTAHNIYSRDQQIICLAGAIAIFNAEELLQQRG